MTISTTTSKVGYNGNGVTTAFSVPFLFLANADLTVVLLSSAGVETTLTLSTHYTVTGAGNDSGGTLTMVTPPAVGERLTILREVALTQETDYISGDPFPAETHERALDRLVMIAQQLTEVVSRSLRFPVSDTASPELPTQSTRSSKLLAFDSSGNLTVAAPVTDSATDLRLDLADLSGSSLVGFTPAGTGVTTRTVQAKLRDVLHVKDFGIIADGVTDDTAAWSALITYLNSLTYQPRVQAGTGLSVVSGPLTTITSQFFLEADNPRDFQIVCSSSSDIFTVTGSASRAESVVFRNIGLNGNAMTGGFLVRIDWAQNVLFENVLFNDPYNGVYARQVGSLTFRDCEFDYIRGTVGVDLYGDNTTRHGENDQIDLVIFDSTVVQSNLPASGGTNSTVLLRADGRVHTIQTDGLRLLNGGIGMQTKNTPALAANLVPRFLVGSSLEVENTYAECLDLQAFREFTPAFLFAVGSHTADGVKLSSSVARFSPLSCSINSNYLHGLNTNGASSVVLSNPTVYNNSLVSSATKSGVFASGSGVLRINGGLCGKETSLPSYTENQKHGIELDGAFSGRLVVDGCDLRNNVTGALYDNGTTAVGSHVSSCPGYNPGGPLTLTVGASPYSYTAGLSQEAITVYSGTGVVSTISGTVVANQSPCAFVLQPRQTVSISYATVPTVITNKS